MEVLSERSEDTGAASCPIDLPALVERIRRWAAELGFSAVGVSDLDVAQPAQRLRAWLAREFHGQMDYMQRNEAVRSDPTRLLAGARGPRCAPMDYRPRADGGDWVGREWRPPAESNTGGGVLGRP